MPPKCFLCASDDAKLVESGIRYDPTGEVWKCQNCGFVYLWPLPTNEQLLGYYSGLYRQDTGKKSISERFEKNQWEAQERLNRLDLSNVYNLLEVGAGSGAFLEAVGANINRVGVEPDIDSRKWIKDNLNIPVYVSLAHLPERKFDLIVMFHVLEHLRNPIEFLEELKDFLLPDGKIIVEVPNVSDIMLMSSSYRKTYFYQKPHLYYFNKETLSTLLEKAGYSSTISTLQRYNLGSHLRWVFEGKNRGDGYSKDLMKSWFSRPYANLLVKSGCSDTLWAELEVSV